jgi:GPH family glycoside/pentoside/hexuronide:cation symporter
MAEGHVKAQGATMGTMFTYGLGGIPVGIKNNLLGTYLLIYYNQVLGLDAVLAASAMAIALVVDAITDPWVGIWSDRVRTRWGRRHPFMYAAIIPFALSYYYILLDPGDISQTGLYYRLIFWMIVLRLSMTFYEIPRGALGPELTKDYDQRNLLSGWNMAFGWFAGAGIAFVANRWFLESFVDLNGYQRLAFWGGLIIFIGGAVSTIGLHKHIPNLHVPEPRKFDLKSFFNEAVETLSNRSWIVLFISGTVYSLYGGIEQSVATYYNQFFWRWTPAEISVYAMCMAVCVIVMSFLAPIIAKGRNKKYIAVGVFLTANVFGPLPVVLRLLDIHYGLFLFPANGTTSLWWIMLLHACFTASIGALGFIFITSMSYEIVEEVQRATKRREEGLLGTVNSFIHKIVGAGGVLVSGIIIGAVGFDAPGVTLSQLQGPIINKFAIIHVILGCTMPFISTLLVLPYKIDRKGHESNIEDLGYVEKSDL